MISPLQKPASYDDILALPEHVVGELVDGELFVSPRPAARHAVAASRLGGEIGPPFDRGRGGPGGWVILDEPELHFGRNVVVPDIAGWRRERMPEIPDVVYFTLAPDWVCEVLSPSTARLDRGKKLAVYAREGVRYLWLIDPLVRTLEILRLDGDTFRIIGVAENQAKVRAEPFDAIELDLEILWAR